jgi:hypothetical protein
MIGKERFWPKASKGNVQIRASRSDERAPKRGSMRRSIPQRIRLRYELG